MGWSVKKNIPLRRRLALGKLEDAIQLLQGLAGSNDESAAVRSCAEKRNSRGRGKAIFFISSGTGNLRLLCSLHKR